MFVFCLGPSLIKNYGEVLFIMLEQWTPELELAGRGGGHGGRNSHISERALPSKGKSDQAVLIVTGVFRWKVSCRTNPIQSSI